jgi:hypothetical protein
MIHTGLQTDRDNFPSAEHGVTREVTSCYSGLDTTPMVPHTRGVIYGFEISRARSYPETSRGCDDYPQLR